MHKSNILAFLACAVLVGSCETPFALKLASYNESGPQQPAAITVSDPQVYSREALINDRLAERKLLERLLTESAAPNFAKNNFTAEIIRELETVEAFTTAARLTLDPAKGRAAKREQSLADLDSQIEREQRQKKLLVAQAETKEAEKRLAAADEEDENTGETAKDDPESVKRAEAAAVRAETAEKNAKDAAKQAKDATQDKQPTPAEIEQKLKEETDKIKADVRQKLKNLDSRLEKVASRFGERVVKAQPRDLLRDLRSYRAEVRQALNAVNLDDLHDNDGNALYRLQFRATVMPGEHKDKFGVARLTFEPPLLSQDDIKGLYRSWLAHLTYRLNQPHHQSRRRCPTSVGSLLRLANAKLFELESIPYPTNPDEVTSFVMETLSGASEKLSDAAKNLGDAERQLDNFILAQKSKGTAALELEDAQKEVSNLEKLMDLAASPAEIAEANSKLEAAKKAAASAEAQFKKLAKISESMALNSDEIFLAQETARQEFNRAYPVFENAIDLFKTKVHLGQQFCTLFLPLPYGSSSFDRKSKLAEYLNALSLIRDSNSHHKPTLILIDALIGKIGRNVVPPTTLKPNSLEAFERLVVQSAGDVREAGFNTLKSETYQQSEFAPKSASRRIANHPWKESPFDFGRMVARGPAYAYAVTPLEHAQRVSTSARAARSFELALALAANLQTQGATAGAKVGYVRESVGMTEALERQPIVVAFADRRSPVERESKGSDPVYASDHQAPQVGWVFGPKTRLNPENSTLELIHNVAAHEISADISVPGWWPRVNAVLETAWIGNWHRSSRQIRLDDESGQGFHREKFDVFLPLNSSDMDGLSSYLARRTLGANLRLLDVRHIEPFYISACTRMVEIVIQGANVWRSTEVRIGGVPAEEIKVLPDMEGVTATFDLKKLFETKNKSIINLGPDQGVPLVVSTRNGTVVRTVRLIGSRTPGGDCISNTTVAGGLTDRRLEVVQITPEYVCATDKTASFLVKTFDSDAERSTAYSALFAGRAVNGGGAINALPSGKASVRVLKVFAEGGPFAAAGNVLPLSISDGEDISTAGVRVVACTQSPSEEGGVAGEFLGTRIVVGDDGTFNVKLRGINAKLFDKYLSLALLPDTVANDVDPANLGQLKREAGVYTATFKAADFKGDVKKAMASVVAVRLMLRQSRATDKFAIIGPITGNPIFYPKDMKAAAVSEDNKPKPLDKKKQDLMIKLPEQHARGFPGLANARIEAWEKDKKEVRFEVENTGNVDGNGVLTARIGLGSAPKSEQAREVNIVLKFVGFDDVPEFPFKTTIPAKPAEDG